MFLKCFWLLRKPSDQKNIFIDERFDYIWILCPQSPEIFMHICLAKISLWSVWRDLREAKCVDLWWIIWKSSNFCGSHSVSKVFKALRRLPKKLKTLGWGVETRIKIQMFLKCFWLLRKPSDQKNIFIDERFDYIWIFMSTKLKIFMHTLA